MAGTIGAPLLLLGYEAFFMIRGYELTKESLFILRLGYRTRIPLEGLLSVESDPDALSRISCTCGLSGTFSYAGTYRSDAIGAYRLFATDPGRPVVLRFSGRAVVVTPESPEAFAAALKALKQL